MWDQSTDVAVDRRAFLARMSVLAGASAVALRAVAHAGTVAPLVGLPSVAVRPEAVADITELTLAEAVIMVRTGRLSPVTLVEAYLDRIGTFDDTLQAFATVVADQALALARTLSSGPRTGLLHGVPLAIKDNYYTAGIETSVSSFVFEGFVPPFDATAVARLVGAGAIVLGKTQMGPLATTRATTPAGVVTTVNAWSPADPAVGPGRVVVRVGHGGRVPAGGLERRHPDRRIHHRAVERAEPDRAQADDGPGVVVRDRPAQLHPRPSRAARATWSMPLSCSP